jgi:uncharacterized membrane protein
MTGAEPRLGVSGWLTRGALAGLWVFTAFTLLGFATFGVNPGLLARFPQFAGIYGHAFRFFAVGHVWLAFAVLALFLAVYAGWRWLPAFFAVYAISLAAELLGTRYGIPFGGYEYTSLMEPMWLGRVPVVIPLSWFYMALPAFALALAVFPGRQRLGARLVAGALALVAWDLALDPAMSFATPYWVWEASGPYYGMPWVNLAGWFATGLLLMAAQEGLGATGWLRGVPIGWLGSFYLVNLVLPLGMNAAAGLWGAVVLTVVVVGAGWFAARRPLRAGGFSLLRALSWRQPSPGELR